MANGDADELGYRVSYTTALQQVQQELRDTNRKLDDAVGTLHDMALNLKTVVNENAELKARVRALELRFYGILAGLITAIGILVYMGSTGGGIGGQ